MRSHNNGRIGDLLSADELGSFTDPQRVRLGVGRDRIECDELVGGDLDGDDLGDGENVRRRNTEELTGYQHRSTRHDGRLTKVNGYKM